ncbi:MAG: hypothetical protein Q8R82_01930 [Hyphomonadaceae bacterium]|nr:hypothetical protein [Hyphomonadaceae bacterium]
MNVALYSTGGNKWAMTERGRLSLKRDSNTITIGPSSMRWEDGALTVDINEWTAPIPSRLRGTVKLRPHALARQAYPLDAGADHYWRPIAPRGRIDVTFDNGTAWSGEAYLDSNWGDEPLEHRFRAWDWSRAHFSDSTIVYYDVAERHGEERSLALKFDATGAATSINAPPKSALPRTLWRMKPTTRGEHDAEPKMVRFLEDAPFYARSHLTGKIDGAPADIMHETLSLDRFSNPVVRAMLPFRMPRLVRRR